MVTEITESADSSGAATSRKQELFTFLITTFVVIPGLSVGFVAAFGFVVWASQMVLGPPGPPG